MLPYSQLDDSPTYFRNLNLDTQLGLIIASPHTVSPFDVDSFQVRV